MNRLQIMIATLALVMLQAVGRADEPAPPTASPPSASGSPADTSATPGAPSGPDAWRYKRHQGLWWYWQPSNAWVYWHEDRWVPYDQKTYGELQASRRATVPQRSYSSNGGWGQWGPIRYDRYGNPQYPYSQRSRGMRQLGPVPTPGGVRSLPGWGGER